MLWLVLRDRRELKRGGSGAKHNLDCCVEGAGLCGRNGGGNEVDQGTVGGGCQMLRESP